METGEPCTFVYRPMPDSKLPEQAIKFDSVLDAWHFAKDLQEFLYKKGIKHILRTNKLERKK